jgi:hypothetical protein
MTRALGEGIQRVNKQALQLYTSGRVTDVELQKIVAAGKTYVDTVEEVLTDTTALELDVFSDPVLAVMDLFTPGRKTNAAEGSSS